MRLRNSLCALLFLGGCAGAELPVHFSFEEEALAISLKEPVWIDGDFGCGTYAVFIADVDDCAALFLLNRSGARILGISAAGGNVTREESFTNAREIAKNIPVYSDEDGTCRSSTVMGFKKATEKEKTVMFAFAPAHNIALFIRCGLEERISRIVFVGGQFRNESFVLNEEHTSIPLSDMNVRKNPPAAQIMFASKIPVTLIPFGAGKRAQIKMKDLRAAGIVLPPSADKAFERWDLFTRFILGASGMPLWDMHAAAYELWPDLFFCTKQKVRVVNEKLIIGDGGRGVDYCLPVYSENLIKTELRTLKNYRVTR